MSQTSKGKDFVLKYFAKIGEIPGKSEAEKLTYDYVSSQMIDSLGIINLITEAESQLNIQFSSDDLESPEFKTIGGLIKIIDGKSKKK